MARPSVTYRILPHEEWGRLRPIMERQGKSVPDPRIAAAAVAEKNGDIVAVGFIQTAVHMEPLVIEDPRASFLRLKEVLDGMLLDKKGLSYYCHTSGPKGAKIAELCGFRRLGDFWVQEV